MYFVAREHIHVEHKIIFFAFYENSKIASSETIYFLKKKLSSLKKIQKNCGASRARVIFVRAFGHRASGTRCVYIS